MTIMNVIVIKILIGTSIQYLKFSMFPNKFYIRSEISVFETQNIPQSISKPILLNYVS